MRRLAQGAIRSTLSSQFVKSVVAVASGTAGAQAIAMLASPLVTRLYGPEAFGQLGVFNSTVNLIAPAAALTLPLAIVLPNRDEEAKQLVRLSVMVAALISLLTGLLLVLFRLPIVALLQIEEIAQYLYLIPVAIFLHSGQQVAQNWLVRKKLFGVAGKTNVMQAFAVNGSYVAGAFLRPVGSVLVWIATMGRLFHVAAMSLAIARRRPEDAVDASEPREGIRSLARRYRDFPLFRAPQELLTGASQSLPIILLAGFFDPATAGFYTLCRTVLSLPSQLLGASVGSVFYPRITEAANRGERLTRLIVKATIALAAVAALPYLMIIAFGPQLFSFVFGAEWLRSGEFARWVAIMSFSTLINRPAAQALPVLSAQGHNLVLSLVTLVLRFIGLYVGFKWFGSAVVAVALYSSVGLLANTALFAMIVRFSTGFDAGEVADRER